MVHTGKVTLNSRLFKAKTRKFQGLFQANYYQPGALQEDTIIQEIYNSPKLNACNHFMGKQ